MKKYILLPSSLTGTSKTSLLHAGNTAKGIDNCTIILLSVIKDEDDFDAAHENLSWKEEWLNDNLPDLEVLKQVVVGDVAKVIDEVAAEYGVEYIFMKTNDSSFWEKIFGNTTMDIVGEAADESFMLIQDGTEYKEGYKTIVVPIDAHVRCKQKMAHVVKLAREYNSDIHLFYTHEKDDFLRHSTEANVKFAEKYLSNKGLGYKEHTTTSSSRDAELYLHDLLEFSNTIEADLIAVVNFQRSFSLLSLPANNFENQLILNSYKIPIFMTNPKAGLVRFS